MLATIMINNTHNIILIIISVLFGFQNFTGQELNENYILFSKSNERPEYLEFKNDSIVARKPYYTHNESNLLISDSTKTGQRIYKDYYYTKRNDTIIIFDFRNCNNVAFSMTDKKHFENSELGMLYVLRKFYKKTPDVAISIEKKILWLDSPKTTNGIVQKTGKKNRKLARIMRKKDTTNIKTQFFKGYEAFEKFGYEYVFGIIEVSEKER